MTKRGIETEIIKWQMKFKMLRNKQQLIQEIHYQVEEYIEEYDISYMEAIMKYIEDNNIEIEAVAPLIKANSTLKEKLYSECEEVNLVEKRNIIQLT